MTLECLIETRIPERGGQGPPRSRFYGEGDTSHWAHSAEHLLGSLCVRVREKQEPDEGAPTFAHVALFAEWDGTYCGSNGHFWREMRIGVGTEFGVNQTASPLKRLRILEETQICASLALKNISFIPHQLKCCSALCFLFITHR